MNTPTDGGPAFPTQQGHCPDGTWNQTYDPGMSLRDWFAGIAMQGFCSMANQEGEWQWGCDGAAKRAYDVADAMLAARNEKATP